MLKFKGYEFQPMDSVLTNFKGFHLTNKWKAFSAVIVKQIKKKQVKKSYSIYKRKEWLPIKHVYTQ